ncbi:MAG: hypothetical protein LIR46_12730 [Bacteroidota bacterium]|nr:hypothetical protein [Bacteroidota bacterium]
MNDKKIVCENLIEEMEDKPIYNGNYVLNFIIEHELTKIKRKINKKLWFGANRIFGFPISKYRKDEKFKESVYYRTINKIEMCNEIGKKYNIKKLVRNSIYEEILFYV